MKFLPCALLLLASSLSTAEPKSRVKGLFEFRDGFLGSAFIERLQSTGHLETMLTAAMPSKNITFRNLGWSGDTECRGEPIDCELSAVTWPRNREGRQGAGYLDDPFRRE